MRSEILQKSRESLRSLGKLNQINPRTGFSREDDFDHYVNIYSRLQDDHSLSESDILNKRISSHSDILRIENNLQILQKKLDQSFNDKLNFLNESDYFIISYLENYKLNRLSLPETPSKEQIKKFEKSICYYVIRSGSGIIETTHLNLDSETKTIKYSEKLLELYELNRSYSNRVNYLTAIFRILVENFIYENYFIKLFPNFESVGLKTFRNYVYHDLITIVLNDRKYVVSVTICPHRGGQKRECDWLSDEQKLPIIKIGSFQGNESFEIIESMKV